MMKQPILASLASLTLLGLIANAGASILGSAQSYAVLGGSTVTNTGSSVLWGDLGVFPGTAITGFGPVDGGPGTVNGTIHAGDSAALQAQSDLASAYSLIAGQVATQDLTGLDLGGMTLTPGVYRFSSSAGLTGALTLDAQGDPNARFDFQIGSTLISASNASVHFINGGSGGNTYWQVGSSATLGTGTSFAGHILASDSITLTTGVSITDGNALARTGAVTLDSNMIKTEAVPEPVTILMLATGLIALRRRHQK
jgi:type VI secretion system secreted protein VgrG